MKFCTDNRGPQKMNLTGFGDPHDFSSSTVISTTVGRISMQSVAVIHVSLRMNCNNFGDSLMSHLERVELYTC